MEFSVGVCGIGHGRDTRRDYLQGYSAGLSEAFSGGGHSRDSRRNSQQNAGIPDILGDRARSTGMQHD